MKANPRSRATRHSRAGRPVPLTTIALAGSLALLSAGCIPQQPATKPPASTPTATPTPMATPTPAPASANWHDAPATPGDWTWQPAPGGSTAAFGLPGSTPRLTLRCERAARTVTLGVPGNALAAPLAFAVYTSATSRALATSAGASGLEAALPAADPLLDAMAFSNGRFALQAPGQPMLYVPSWTEVSRVIEDCR